MAGTTSKTRLLCEGWIEEGAQSAAVCLPEFGYVKQGNKVWVAFGTPPRGLTEAEGATVRIVESIDELELEERLMPTGATVKFPKGGKWIVEGPAQRSDVKNANQRVYPRKIWEKLIGDQKSYVQESIRARAMIGHLEHPKDGRTDLGESAILTVSAELREDGTVWNRFELLETPKGLILQELTMKGVRWGVSSRGNGSVDDAGNVNEADYTMKAWDAVAAPSTPGAFVAPNLGESNTDVRGQDPHAGRASASLRALKTLVESDHVGLDHERRTLSDSLLRVLGTLNESVARSLLQSGDWATVQRAVDQVRTLCEPADVGERIDAVIEDALVSGEASEEAGLVPVIESLQRQVASSMQEQTDLQHRLEAAESEARELQRVHEEALEQLSTVREELRRANEQRDLAHELLSEASKDPEVDERVTAKVDDLMEAKPALAPFRALLLEAATVGRADEVAERLIPSTSRLEETPDAACVGRTSLPVGMVESLDVAPAKRSSTTTVRGAELAGAALSGIQKRT